MYAASLVLLELKAGYSKFILDPVGINPEAALSYLAVAGNSGISIGLKSIY